MAKPKMGDGGISELNRLRAWLADRGYSAKGDLDTLRRRVRGVEQAAPSTKANGRMKGYFKFREVFD